jgi:hypothetical protein
VKAAQVEDGERSAARAQIILYGIVGFAALSLGWMCAILLGHVLHTPLEKYPAGVLGWIVVHNYSKRHEEVLYALSIVGSFAFIVATYAEWWWFSRRLMERGVSALKSDWIAVATLLVGAIIFLAALPGGTALLNVLLLPEAIVAIGIAQYVAWKLSAKAIDHGGDEASGVLEASLDLNRYNSTSSAAQVLTVAYGIVIALLTGAVAGCFLPFVISDAVVADDIAGLWFVWLFVFPCAGAVVTWRLVSHHNRDLSDAFNRALYLYAPIVLLTAMPFFWESLRVRAGLLVLVIVAVAALTVLVFSSRKLPRLRPWVLVGFIALLLAAVNADASLLQNPTFARGLFVSPFDGENIYDWVNNGVLGRVPFRDFFYPYGPLFFYFQVAFARVFHLDTYVGPYDAALGFVAVGLAFFIGGVVQRWRFTTLLIAPTIFLVYEPAELRVWIGCTAIAMLLLALERPTRWLFLCAGLLLPVALLWSPEIGITSTLAACCAVLLFVVSRRKNPRPFPWRPSVAFFAIGYGLIIGPAFILGVVTHSLIPYLRQMRDFFQILTACCASPFHPLFVDGSLSVPAGPSVTWLLRDPTFHTFYVGPVVICIAMAFFLIRFFALKKLERDDIMVGTFIVFAILLFRTALGRSEEGHAEFVMLPEYFIGYFLAERAVFAGLPALREALGFARKRESSAMVVWAAQGLGCLAFAWLMVFGLFRVQDTPAWQILVGTVHNVQAYYTIERAPVIADFSRPSWHKVVSSDGDTFFFQNAAGADVAPTVAYLKQRMNPGDLVYGFPFAPRFPLVLNLPIAVPMGQDLGWGPAAIPKRQLQLIAQFEASRTRFLVYSAADWPDPDGVPWMDRTPAVATYFFTHYTLVKRFGDTLVFERKLPPDPPQLVDAGSLLSIPFLRSGWYYPENSDAGRFSWMTNKATAVASQMKSDNYFEIEVLTTPLPANGPGANFLVIDVDGKQILSRDLSVMAPGLWRFGSPVPPTTSTTVRRISLSVDRTLPLPSDLRSLSLPVLQFGFTHRSGAIGSTRVSVPMPKPSGHAVVAAQSTPVPVGPSYPLGVLSTAQNPVTGIFAGVPGGSCCWTTSAGSFSLRIPKSATQLVAHLQVPSLYGARAQGLTIKIGNFAPEAKHGLAIGDVQVAFVIPKPARGKMADVQFSVDKTFVPAELHINSDTTRYGIIMNGIHFK